MARIRCSGGIVLEGPERVWLVDEPGDEVHDWRRHKAAPVVVAPAYASPAAVARARREAMRLVAAGGPLVAAAGVDLGQGFRSARLDGGDESRRDCVLAAVEVLGIEGLERIGDRAAVLVALFGVRATRRVGAAALEALGRPDISSVRLAVAASDLLGPEQLEHVLGWSASVPTDAVPVPGRNAALLAEHLSAVLGPFTTRRRIALLRSVWDDVAVWNRSQQARARARRRRFSTAGLHAWLRRIATQHDRWWREQARPALGASPSAAAMLSWTPDPVTWHEALFNTFQEAIAATALLRTVLAAEEQPVEAAVLTHLDELTFAATAHLRDVTDRTRAVLAYEPRHLAATDRAAAVAAAAVAGADPRAGDGRHRATPLAALLRNVAEIAHAVLDAAIAQYVAIGQTDLAVPPAPAVAGWRELTGYSPVRPPHLWSHRAVGPPMRPSLAERMDNAAVEPASVELIDDGLWLMDLADTVANWYGHGRADITWLGLRTVVVNPPIEPPDFRLPLLESVPLAMAGAAQLVSLGATPPARPNGWQALAAGLVASAEALGFADDFVVAPEVAAWNGRELAGTGLRIQVARTARQLAEWGNFMGNCIGTYADQADATYSLVALWDASDRLVANVAVYRSGGWRIEQALGRFNEDLPHDLELAIRAWVDQLRPARSSTRPARSGTPARRTGRAPRGRRAPSRERLTRAAAELGEVIGDVRQARPVAAAEPVLRPVASALGWTGDDADWLSLFVTIARPRREGPLAAALADALAGDGCPLAELWVASGYRPLAAGLAGQHEDADIDLRRLTDPTVPPSLRLALREPRIWNARVIDLAGRKVRTALGALLRAGDESLDQAVAARPHVEFLTAAVLTLTAEGTGSRRVSPVRVANDGTVPGHPRSSVADPDGPWQQARPATAELGTAPDDVTRVLVDAPGRRLLVPTAWLPARGWGALWARAHRTTREAARAARE